MATYGSGQMLGSGINPESFKQDYSGFARAAEMQAQGLSNLGGSIAGAIKDYGQAKQEQKKVDAYNKASAKSIEAALTLADSYRITGAEQTLRPFLSVYNDPNLSPIEKAAMLDEGKAMIPNLFSRFDKSQAIAIENAQIKARNAPQPRNVNLQQSEISEIVNGQEFKTPVIFNPETGETRRLDGSLVSPGFQSSSGIDSALNLSLSPLDQEQAQGDGTTAYGEPGVLPIKPSNNPALGKAIAEANNMVGIPAQASIVEAPPESQIQQPSGISKIPFGSVPVQTTEERVLTKEEQKRVGLPEDGQFIGTIKGKVITNIAPIPSGSEDAMERNRKLYEQADELYRKGDRKSSLNILRALGVRDLMGDITDSGLDDYFKQVRLEFIGPPAATGNNSQVPSTTNILSPKKPLSEIIPK